MRGVRSEEAGVATVVVVALIGVLLLVTLAVAWLGAVVARHRAAQSAADLAALAGASALQQGTPGCAQAAEVAAANNAQLESCDEQGEEVFVTVSVSAPALVGRQPTVLGRARAGPVVKDP